MTVCEEFECEVAIAGGGPVGVTLALLLGKFGIRTIVLERDVRMYASPRAVGVDDLALRVWQSCGVMESLLPGMTPLGPDGAGMVFHGGGGRRLVTWRPDSRIYGWPRGVTMVQPDVEAVLRNALRACECVRFLSGYEVTEVKSDIDFCRIQGTRSVGGNFRVEAQFAIGCEGAHSPTRCVMGTPLQGRRGLGRWLIADVAEGDAGGRSPVDIEVFGAAHRAAVSVPRRGGHRRWEFELPERSTVDSVPSEARLRELIESLAGSASVRILRSLVHEYRMGQASFYARGRLALAGDSAHVMPPYAAQGLSCGLHDAANLAWRLWLAVRHGADAARLLTDYSRERRAAVACSLMLSRLMQIMVAPGSSSLRSLRDILIRTGLTIPAVRGALTRGGMRVFSGYAAGSIVPGGVAGRMLPQPRCVDFNGEQRPLDDLLGTGFALLMRPPCGLPEHAPSALPNIRLLTAVSEPPRTEREIRIAFERRDQWLPLRPGDMLLLRPDRVVLAHSRMSGRPELMARARAALGLV